MTRTFRDGAAMNIGIYISLASDAWVCVAMPYDQVAIQIIKSLGRGHYRFDPAEKAWYVMRQDAPRLKDWLEGAGFDVEWIEPEETRRDSDEVQGLRLELELAKRVVQNLTREKEEQRQEFRRLQDLYIKGAPSGHWEAILRSLPAPLAEKLYRIAARTLHPDTGGTNDAMRDLNVGWEAVKPRRQE